VNDRETQADEIIINREIFAERITVVLVGEALVF
jgi:hypothetical protein